MNSETKRAAERIRDRAKGDDVYSDLDEVVNAYLAEHDETPVDEAWLRNIGWGSNSAGPWLFSPLIPSSRTEIQEGSCVVWDAQVPHFLSVFDTGDGIRILLGRVDTRGQLLALLRGFGINTVKGT